MRAPRYPYIAANTIDREGEAEAPALPVIERAGVRVGFIGVTTPVDAEVPGPEVTRARFRFTDISDAVNRWVPVLRAQGVRAIVVLAHAGGPSQDESDAPDFVGRDRRRGARDEPRGRRGDRRPQPLAARHPGARTPAASGDKLIVEALSYGIAFDLVDLTIDRRTGDVVAKSGEVPETPHDVAGDPRMARAGRALPAARGAARDEGRGRHGHGADARRGRPRPAGGRRGARVREGRRRGGEPRCAAGGHRRRADHLRRRRGGVRLRPSGHASAHHRPRAREPSPRRAPTSRAPATSTRTGPTPSPRAR